MRLTAFVWLLVIAQNPAYAADPSKLPAVPGALKSALVNYTRPYLKTVSEGREVHLYSWLDRAQELVWTDQATGKSMTSDPDPTHQAFLDPRSSAVKNYLKMIEHQFRDTSGTGTAIAGDGIYANSDPVGTASYGGSGGTWALSQFVLVGGTRFLDTMSDPGFASSTALTSAIAQSGLSCNATQLVDLFNYARSSADCQAMRNAVVDGLGSQGLGFQIIRYSYDSAASYAQCPNRPQGAFVIFSNDSNWDDAVDNGVNWGRWISFTGALPPNSSGDPQYGNRLLIQGMFELTPNASSANYNWSELGTPAADGTIDYLPWPALKGKADASATQSWMKDHIVGCGSYAEDQAGPVGGSR